MNPELFLPASRLERHRARGEWPVPSAAQLLAERLRNAPDREFLIDGTQRLSFRAFEDRVSRLVAGLRALGVRRGDVVSWQLPSWWEAAVLAVALEHLGAVQNPILPIYRETEVGFIARETGTRILFVPGTFRSFDYRELARSVRAQVPSIEHVVVVRDRPFEGARAFGDLLGERDGRAPVERDLHEVSFVFYTSGTTSEPKGVLHSTSTLGAFARANARVSGSSESDVSLLQFPLTHIGGLAAFVVLPLLVGSRVVYLDVWDPERALDLVEKEGVTSAGGPPPILQGILSAPGFRPERVRTLRTAGTGAADIPPELVREVRRRLGVKSFRSYGLTECPMLTSGRPEDPEEKCVSTDGRPSPGCEVRIVDESGRACPPGTEGEIECFGPQLCLGYWNSELDREAFTADGFLRTGDLGILDEEGYLRVTGRKKDIIIRKGENLSAKSIEDVLYEHPAVADAAVVGLPDPECGEKVCACVVLRPGASLTLAELARFMEEKRVMKQKIPERLEILPSLPRNATGKVKKFELRARFSGR
ncbi:MAG: long-chain-fatty-acid--CoA ligase [Candidatus Binatia bacterium]|nr:MAG: long-chain-fatty-acid--CoA ligase [Candidatus Binatia bacterium]